MAVSAPLMPQVGVNQDLSDADIPDGAVTNALNVRYREGNAESFLGQVDAYAQTTGPASPIVPLTAYPVLVDSVRYWLVLGQAKAYCTTGTPAVWTNVTRQTAAVDVDYAATTANRWNGGVLNGVPIVNNGVDIPQMWAPVGPTTKLTALTNWQTDTRAKVLRVFNFQGIALGLTVAGAKKPHRLRWSHPADPGTVPSSWDVADATKLAGEVDISGDSELVDGFALRDSFIVYKQNSTTRMSFVGGNDQYSFHQIFANSGMLAANCAVEVDGSHVVLTNNDVIIHDGNTLRSVVDKSTRRRLFQSINQQASFQCFVTKNVYFNEVWICYPELGQTTCTRALVYNYKDNTSSFRQLPNVVSGSTGQVDDSNSLSWQSDTDSWEDDLSGWDENEFGADQERTLLCSTGRQSLVLCDSGTKFFGANIQGAMERTGLAFKAPNTVKVFSRLRMRFKGPIGAVLTVTLGAQMVQGGGIAWGTPTPFRIGIDTSVDSMVTGRFAAYRIEANIPGYWRLQGLEAEFLLRGQW